MHTYIYTYNLNEHMYIERHCMWAHNLKMSLIKYGGCRCVTAFTDPHELAAEAAETLLLLQDDMVLLLFSLIQA